LQQEADRGPPDGLAADVGADDAEERPVVLRLPQLGSAIASASAAPA
jgi:hypothetical protein